MAQDKKYIQQDDEIDLVELLGVIIKWRKVIFVFVAAVTILGASILTLKEYRSSSVQSGIAFEESLGSVDRYVVTIENEPIFASFRFLKEEDRGNIMNVNYKKFLTSMLFPSAADSFKFETEDMENTENVKSVLSVLEKIYKGYGDNLVSFERSIKPLRIKDMELPRYERNFYKYIDRILVDDKNRMIFELLRTEKYSSKEIANKVNLSERALYARKKRIIDILERNNRLYKNDPLNFEKNIVSLEGTNRTVYKLEEPKYEEDFSKYIDKVVVSDKDKVAYNLLKEGVLLDSNIADIKNPKDTESDNRFSISYFFHSLGNYSKFMTRYRRFIDLLEKTKTYRTRMDERLYFDCINKYLFRVSESRGFLSSPKERELCSYYHYYSDLVKQKISHAAGISFNFNYAYLDFITGFLKGLKISKVKKMEVATKNIRSVKTSEHLNTKKVVKYSVIVFVLSIIMALFLVFILEFWVKNKERINKYLR